MLGTFYKKGSKCFKTQLEGLIGVGAAVLARATSLANLQVELVLLVAAHVGVRHEVERVAGGNK